MLRLNAIWLIPVALCGGSFSSAPAKASEQTTYTFNSTYDTINTTKVFSPDVSSTISTGESSNAQYGLTKINNLIYGQTDLATGKFSLNTNSTIFGLQDVPKGYIELSSSDGDKLFGTNSAVGMIDFAAATAQAYGTVNITGGEGRFTGAIGTLSFERMDTFGDFVDDTLPFKGKVSLNGSWRTVPEPRMSAALVSLGVIGASFLLYQRHCRVSKMFV
jgi:hypothetical protein